MPGTPDRWADFTPTPASEVRGRDHAPLLCRSPPPQPQRRVWAWAWASVQMAFRPQNSSTPPLPPSLRRKVGEVSMPGGAQTGTAPWRGRLPTKKAPPVTRSQSAGGGGEWGGPQAISPAPTRESEELMGKAPPDPNHNPLRTEGSSPAPPQDSSHPRLEDS